MFCEMQLASVTSNGWNNLTFRKKLFVFNLTGQVASLIICVPSSSTKLNYRHGEHLNNSLCAKNVSLRKSEKNPLALIVFIQWMEATQKADILPPDTLVIEWGISSVNRTTVVLRLSQR